MAVGQECTDRALTFRKIQFLLGSNLICKMMFPFLCGYREQSQVP